MARVRGSVSAKARRICRKVCFTLINLSPVQTANPFFKSVKSVVKNSYSLSREDRSASPGLKNLHGHPLGHLIDDPRGIPIGQPNTAMTSRTANGIRARRPMDPNAPLAQSDPGDSDRVPWSGWNIVKVLASFTMIQHGLVPTEPGHRSDSDNFPGPDRRR